MALQAHRHIHLTLFNILLALYSHYYNKRLPWSIITGNECRVQNHQVASRQNGVSTNQEYTLLGF